MAAPLSSPSTNRYFNPFDLDQEYAYQSWRDWKLEQAPTRPEQLLVEVKNPHEISPSEREAIEQRCAHTNMALYACNANRWKGKDIPQNMGHAFGLENLDHNWLADDDAITSIQVKTEENPSQFIPYTNRAIQWHTDGYYNPAQQQIQGLLLHCENPAYRGGENALLDPDIAYIYLRDLNPALVQALMQEDTMTIPARSDASGVVRLPQTGPIFSVNSNRCSLHMRYTARTRSIEWKKDPLVEEARQRLHELLLSDLPYILHCKLEAGMGLISNNVLHNRTAFEDHPQQACRLLYRARYYDRIQNTSLINNP